MSSTPDQPTTPPGAARRGPLWPWALAAGLAAGLAAYLAGEATNDAYEPVLVLPANYNKLGSYDKDAAISAAMRVATPPAESKNTALAYGALGGLLGAALGLAGGLARRAPGRGLVAAAVGLAVGAAAGAGAGFGLTPVFYRMHHPESAALLVPVMIHAGIWGAVGGAAGLAFGLGAGGPRSMLPALVGGLTGAVLGAVLFEAFSAVTFPLVRVFEPVPSGQGSRFAAHLFVAAGAALGAGLGVGRTGEGPARGKPEGRADLERT